MRRREFLGAGLAGAACGAAGRWQEPVPAAPGAPGVEPMAKAVLATPADGIVRQALRWHAQGASERDLLGAALLAGTHEVNPKPIGGQVHAMMMVASASGIGAWLRGRDRLLPALFNLTRVKNSQRRDQRSGDWTMPAAPPADERATPELLAAFAGAMAEWDEDTTDRMAVSLHARVDADTFFEQLWPWAVRDFRVIGHKAIYAAQAHRALGDLGWRHGRDVVRSVLFGVLDQNPYNSASRDQSEKILALFPANRERAAALAPRAGASDVERSFELLAAMRTAEPDAAAAEVAAAAAGASTATLWDALRLRAFEQLLRLPTIAGVHPVTSLNALRHIASAARDEHLPALCLLQGASWLSLFEGLVAQRGDADRLRLRIATVEPGGDSDPFAAALEAERRACAARWLADGRDTEFAQRTAEVLAQKAREDHDYKFAAAALEEIAAADVRLRPRFAGAAMSFLHHGRDPDSDVFLSALPLLR